MRTRNAWRVLSNNICALFFGAFLDSLVEHSDVFFVTGVVIISELPELFDSANFAVPFVESLSEPEDTAKCNVPAVHSCGVKRFRNGCFATPAFDNLVDLSSVEVTSVDERVASLTCCHNYAVLKGCSVECFRFFFAASMTRTRVTALIRVTSGTIVHVVVRGC